MKLLLILFLCMSNFFSYSQDQEVNEDPINRLFGEAKQIKEFVKSSQKRNEQIKSFKIKFTNLITDLASQSFYKLEYQQSFQDINGLEQKAIKWKEEEESFNEKTNDLMNVVEQSLNSYKESVYSSKGDLRYELSQNINDLSRIKSRLINYRLDLKRHRKGIEQFLKNISDWKALLKDKMTKSFNQNFMRWEFNRFIIEPVKITESLKRQVVVSLETWAAGFKKVDWKKKMAPLFLIFSLAIALFWIIYFLLSKIVSIYKGTDGLVSNDFRGRLFLTVLSSKSLVAMWIVFFVTERVADSFFPGNPHLVFFVFLFILLLSTWFFFKEEIQRYVLEIIGHKKPTKTSVMLLIFIALIVAVSRAFQIELYIKSELMVLFDSLLLAYICFQFSRYIYQNLTQVEHSKITKSTRFIIFLISTLIFISTLLEFIGFVHLSRIIQEVVLSNTIILIAIWFVFGVIDNLLRYFLDSYQSFKNFSPYGQDIIKYVKQTLGNLFILVVILVIIGSWMKNVFIFPDFLEAQILSLGSYQIRLKQPLQLLVLYYFFKGIYLVFKYVFYSFLLKSLNLERKNAPNVLAIVRYLLIFFFISAGLGILGFTYKNILIFASALGVGIGFGLQNIVNNFLSGIILLFEQPVRVGDIIEINGILATVVNIGIRSTIVESYDNSAIIIPNSEIVSNNLINWTLKDNVIAVECYVGVAYGTDTRFVSGLILEALKEQREILSDPAAQVWFKKFGESSLDFTVRFWINKPKDKFLIESRVMHAINAQLNQHNIVIPFPQRDIHIREALAPTEKQLEESHDNSEENS